MDNNNRPNDKPNNRPDKKPTPVNNARIPDRIKNMKLYGPEETEDRIVTPKKPRVIVTHKEKMAISERPRPLPDVVV